MCLIAAIGFLCWRAPYGFGFEDESCYLTFPYRFMMGDSPLTDEWLISQLFSVLLYLPVKIYVLISGSTEGIILFFRYLFIAFQGTISIAIYCRFRKYGLISIFTFLIFCLYVPATVMALSHYSFITGISVLIGLMLSSEKRNRATLFIVGIFFACLVLCNAFLAAVYFIYFLFVIILLISRRKNSRFFKQYSEYFSMKTWFWISLGIAFAASIFLIFLFSRTTVHEIIINLPHIFEDSQYRLVSEDGKTQNIISIKETILGIININPYLFAVYAALISVIFIDKNRVVRKFYYLIAGSVIAAAYILLIISSSKLYSYFLCMFPLTLLGLVCYILSKNKDKHLFFFLWVWGIIVAFFQDVASDQGYLLMSIGIVGSVVAGIIFMGKSIDEADESSGFKPNKHKDIHSGSTKKKVTASILVTVLLFQIGFECYILADFKSICPEYFYNDYLKLASIGENLDVTVQRGPAKGLITTENTASIYNNILSDLSYIKDRGKGALLIAANYPWGYLYAGMPYATYTTWFLADRLPETMQRLSEYYKLHPEKSPEYIYVPKKLSLFIRNDSYSVKYANEVLSYIAKKYDYKITEGKEGYIVRITDIKTQ
jgi:hypothetical protein